MNTSRHHVIAKTVVDALARRGWIAGWSFQDREAELHARIDAGPTEERSYVDIEARSYQTIGVYSEWYVKVRGAQGAAGFVAKQLEIVTRIVDLVTAQNRKDAE